MGLTDTIVDRLSDHPADPDPAPLA
jgi:hypothetical protein